MLNFLKTLLGMNSLLAAKLKAQQAYDEGVALRGAGNFKDGYLLILQSSELGNENAMAILGSIYLLGEGVAQNGKEAVRWLEKAIELGCEDATPLLGMALVTGKAGVKLDLNRGRQMLEHAAEHGDKQSARMLSMIDRGEGMFKRMKKSTTKR
jgi:TPR repeat protein